MSGDITINGSTTAKQLHDQVYDPELITYQQVYENLKVDFPQFETLINEALVFSEQMISLQQEDFIEFINEQIGELYEDISEAAFFNEDDDVAPIVDEL